MLKSMGLQRVGHDWATEQQQKEVATHSSILAWRIPWTEELGELQSTGSQRVRHDWASSLFFTIWLFRYFNMLGNTTNLPQWVWLGNWIAVRFSWALVFSWIVRNNNNNSNNTTNIFREPLSILVNTVVPCARLPIHILAAALKSCPILGELI